MKGKSAVSNRINVAKICYVKLCVRVRFSWLFGSCLLLVQMTTDFGVSTVKMEND